MDSNQLMIGDLVINKETKRYVRISLNTFKFCEDWDRYEPVPLTEVILKANGFGNYCGNEWVYMGDEQDVQISVWLYSKRTDIDTSRDSIRFHPHYVHQLQHALRLANLDYLADNFIVE